MALRIGVLALQGAFALHRPHIEALGAEYCQVVECRDLENLDALILPGGESATMLKLIHIVSLWSELKKFSTEKPTWGICAGAILLARTVSNPTQESFAAIDITIERNAYGRQLDSREELVASVPVSFIRAPRISALGKDVRLCASRGEDPIWVESANVMVTTFHPETHLQFPSPWHQRLAKGFAGGVSVDT